MGTREEEREQARKLGRQINHNARSNVDSPYTGKVVGILHGEVVIVADTLDEVAEALERLEPGPQRRYFIDASADYDAPHTCTTALPGARAGAMGRRREHDGMGRPPPHAAPGAAAAQRCDTVAHS